MFTVQPPPRCCSPHTSGIAVSPDMWHEFSAPIAATCDWPEVPAIEICGWRHSLAMSGYAVDETPPMAFTACRSLVLWFLSVHSTSGIATSISLCSASVISPLPKSHPSPSTQSGHRLYRAGGSWGWLLLRWLLREPDWIEIALHAVRSPAEYQAATATMYAV